MIVCPLGELAALRDGEVELGGAGCGSPVPAPPRLALRAAPGGQTEQEAGGPGGEGEAGRVVPGRTLVTP